MEPAKLRAVRFRIVPVRHQLPRDVEAGIGRGDAGTDRGLQQQFLDVVGRDAAVKRGPQMQPEFVPAPPMAAVIATTSSRRIQMAELTHVMSSRAAATSLAEHYVGLPLLY